MTIKQEKQLVVRAAAEMRLAQRIRPVLWRHMQFFTLTSGTAADTVSQYKGSPDDLSKALAKELFDILE